MLNWPALDKIINWQVGNRLDIFWHHAESVFGNYFTYPFEYILCMHSKIIILELNSMMAYIDVSINGFPASLIWRLLQNYIFPFD